MLTERRERDDIPGDDDAVQDVLLGMSSIQRPSSAANASVKIVSGICGGNLYTVGDGYFYRVKSKRENKVYLICKTRGCCGRAICNGDDLKLTHKHTCSSDIYYEDVVQLKKRILKRCAVESKKLSAIFREECKKVSAQVAAEVSFKQMESCMLKTRRTKLDGEGLANLKEAEGDEADLEDEDDEIVASTCYRSVAFGKLGTVVWLPKDLGHLLHSNEWHLAICNPRPGPISQDHLFTILAIVHGMSFPIVLAYVETPSKESYSAILSHIKEISPSVLPEVVVGDLEDPIVEAVSEQFPTSRFLGSWLHYSQAIITEVHSLDLVTTLKGSTEARFCVKLLLALPLLPGHLIMEGYKSINSFASTLGVNYLLSLVFLYLENRWLKELCPDNFSMYGQPERCTNAQSSFHRELADLLGARSSLDLWDFSEGVSELCRSCSRDYLRYLQGESISDTRSLVVLTEDKTVAGFIQRLQDGSFSLMEFLSSVAAVIADSILWEKRALRSMS